ncbi:hypothetical protein [Flavobacterium sp. 102]|uniref:hypothetical protein n=1 Tax=Flavobacterium sp. 102 TaxID=2135623 RepID=UPI000EB4EF9B|nr:hypothetical protein [Flavobacterium sp. 102]
MQTRTFFFISIISFLLISCGTGLKIPQEQLSGINSNFKGTFINISHKKNSKNKASSDSDILTLINLKNKKSDSVSISFTSNNELKVTYDDVIGKTTEYYQGKFSKKGYYEIFIRKKNIQIPPVLHLLYSKIDIYRLRISLNKEKELIIDSYYKRGGNVFLLAAGGSGRTQYYFKATK